MKLTLCSLVAMALASVLSANGLELVPGGAYARVWAPFASSVRVAGHADRTGEGRPDSGVRATRDQLKAVRRENGGEGHGHQGTEG